MRTRLVFQTASPDGESAENSWWPARWRKAAFLECDDAAGEGGLDDAGDVLAHKWSAASTMRFMASEREREALYWRG